MSDEQGKSIRESLEENMALLNIEEPVKEVVSDEVINAEPKENLTEEVINKENNQDKLSEQAPSEELHQEVNLDLQRPTHWKKDYLPIWDKIANGVPLDAAEAKKLAAYSKQRETEYASGVSKYKTEADNYRNELENSKQFTSALEPFIPLLQQNNIKPNEWISNLGNAHKTLALGSPEQKIQMFSRLAKDYGIPLESIFSNQNGNLDPAVPGLMQQIQDLSNKLNGVQSWREQQEQQQIDNIIAEYRDEKKYPHFEAVRATMSQFLGNGMANDLKTAYEKAVRYDDNVWAKEQERLAQENAIKQQEIKASAAAKAKANAISPRPITPNGKAMTSFAQDKDRRALLEENFDSIVGGRI